MDLNKTAADQKKPKLINNDVIGAKCKYKTNFYIDLILFF